MLRGMSADGLLGLDLRYRRSRYEYLAYTQEKLNKVNAEFDKIADECYQRARQIVQANAELIKKTYARACRQGKPVQEGMRKRADRAWRHKGGKVRGRLRLLLGAAALACPHSVRMPYFAADSVYYHGARLPA